MLPIPKEAGDKEYSSRRLADQRRSRAKNTNVRSIRNDRRPPAVICRFQGNGLPRYLVLASLRRLRYGVIINPQKLD